jgi:hypothetical protein
MSSHISLASSKIGDYLHARSVEGVEEKKRFEAPNRRQHVPGI